MVGQMQRVFSGHLLQEKHVAIKAKPNQCTELIPSDTIKKSQKKIIIAQVRACITSVHFCFSAIDSDLLARACTVLFS